MYMFIEFGRLGFKLIIYLGTLCDLYVVLFAYALTCVGMPMHAHDILAQGRCSLKPMCISTLANLKNALFG